MLRQGGEATGGRKVRRGFRQELAPVGGIGVDVVEIGCSFEREKFWHGNCPSRPRVLRELLRVGWGGGVGMVA